MFSRFALGIPRLASPVSIRFVQTSYQKGARFGGNTAGGFKFAQNSGFGVRSGPTLKERLLGPTTGKPFIYGTYILAGSAAFGIGLLAYYGLASQDNSIIQNSALWPKYVKERISSSYAYLAGSLAITAASGVAASRSPTIMRFTAGGGFLALIGTMAAVIGTGMLCRSINYEQGIVKHAAWLLHCGTLGAILAPMCMLGGPVLVRAAWYTAGLISGLSAIAITAPSEKFLMMSGPLAMGLGVVFVANIGTFFLPPGSALGASLASVVMYGGLILFSAFLMYDTQRLVKKAEHHPVNSHMYGLPIYDPINAQLSLYMDVVNIFIRMAMILSGSGSNRRK